MLGLSELIASDAFAERARHPDFPRAFTRGRKLPLPALIAALLSMRSGSQQVLLDTFFSSWKIEEAFKRLKHRYHLEAVSGLSQQALIVDMAAKVLADNLASLICLAAQAQRQDAATPATVPRRCNRAYATHAMPALGPITTSNRMRALPTRGDIA